jgi:hypothetical protein
VQVRNLVCRDKTVKRKGKKKRKEEEEDSNMCCTELDRKLDDSLGMETAYSQWAVWC